jgi:hypothetical protein
MFVDRSQFVDDHGREGWDVRDVRAVRVYEIQNGLLAELSEEGVEGWGGGMKLAIVGSRTFRDAVKFKRYMNSFDIQISEVVTGGAIGTDQMAEMWAKARGIPVKVIRPEYKIYGRSAAIIRNIKIVFEADQVIAFWDGQSRGTKFTIEEAKRREKSVRVIQV